ncbi:hypothetical protein ACH3VR_09295 [Microbacterium sp. B2969]|uniref:DUF317 domain-containing protein n=1 Tax=Microbacterium alkaliflavum TaxID=3248839 RepID=A0ABW7Q8R3_9MICO
MHYLRFNRALAQLALAELDSAHPTAGWDAARQSYEEAVRCLEPDAACPGGGIPEPSDIDSLRMAALTDLELFDDSDSVDTLRAIVLGAADDEETADEPGRLTLDVFPLELQLGDEELSSTPVRIIWYARHADDEQWAVLPGPTWSTIEVGDHLNQPFGTWGPTSGYELRADVYIGGSRQSFVAADDDVGPLSRVVSALVGVSAAVPDGWRTWPTPSEMQWHVGPDETSGLWLRRVEGAVPDDLVEPYLTAAMREWAAGTLGAFPDPVAGESPWLFGGDDVVEEWSGDAIAGATLHPFGIDAFCGGTVFEAIVGGEGVDADTAAQVYSSLVLDRAAVAMPYVDRHATVDGLAIDLPDDWDAAVGMDAVPGPELTAGSCTDGAYIDAHRYSAISPFPEALEAELAYLRDSDYVVESVDDHDVPGATDAAVIHYTWTSDSGTVYPRFELFAHAGDDDEWILNFDDYGSESTQALLDALSSVEFTAATG